MTERGFTPNNNREVLGMISRELGKWNKGRNRILLGAVALCIAALTMVFGISFGKVQAEYTKAVRSAGMTASTILEDADQSQYEMVNMLGYVRQVGRRVMAGQSGCTIQWLDEHAWDKIIKPAYTEIHGDYPKEEQELMLSAKTLKNMKIDEPKVGMKISLDVNISFFQTKQEVFKLCGWYTDYVEETSSQTGGYISKKKLQDWGYNIEEKSDLLICQSDNMDWQETEERLYKDIPMKSSGQTILASNPYMYDAVNRFMGSYEMAVLGSFAVLGGMFFLIYNVMQISMLGDVRQLGLLNVIGTTKKQIRKIYYKQINRILIPGVFAGVALSAVILLAVIPKILGKQYLSGYGGAEELAIFRPEILIVSVIATVLLILSVAAGVIGHVVNVSCVESIHYTGLEKGRRIHKKKKEKRIKYNRISAGRELWYMAWQNVTRYRMRFLLTICSLFLAMEVFLGVIVITSGSDYAHVIESRPDFLIAGKFSEWGQESGYGSEYKLRDAGEDPMKTEGDIFSLLYANEYEEFSPISSEAREQLLALQGVNKKKSYIMEGAYMVSTISANGVRPLTDESELPQNKNKQLKEGVGYYGSGYEMLEGVGPDVIQILSEGEIKMLKTYTEQEHLSVDMKALEEGTGVMILHDHQLSPTQERQAEKSVGEPLYFTTLLKREDKIMWNQKSAKEKDELTNGEELTGKKSETFLLSGYLDNQAEGFPNIRQTWHGREGDIYYLISEKGFEKLPTEKKTLYMELEVDERKETQIKSEIQKIVSQVNQVRAQRIGTGADDESGEAGIFCISKSDILSEAANYIRGNRLILGSISAVLLFTGITNYFNIMITGILSRRKEFEIMQSIGMTDKQKQNMLMAEGGYYCLIVTCLLLTLGSGILKLISFYMEKHLSYFVYSYPYGWLIILIGGLGAICLIVSRNTMILSNVLTYPAVLFKIMLDDR